MKNKFDRIRELLNEIDDLFEEVEKHKQVYDLDKLNKLNEMLKIFKTRKQTIINDTFDVGGIDEDGAISKLESLKKLMILILELEKNINENKMKKSQLKALIKEQVTSILKEDSYKKLLLDKIKDSKLSEDEKKKYLDKCNASDFNSNDIPKLITQIEQEESKKKLNEQDINLDKLGETNKEIKSTTTLWKKSEGEEKQKYASELKKLLNIKKELERIF